MSSKSERLPFILFAFIQACATCVAILASLLAPLLAHSLIDVARWQEASFIFIIVFAIVGVSCVNLALDYRGLDQTCVLFSDASVARVVLVLSSITAGISMAFFVTLLVNLHISLSLTMLPLLVVSFYIAMVQLAIALSFSKKEADLMGGDLTVVSIGILAVSMGFAFPAALAALPHSIAVEYFTIAVPLVGSGLGLIAKGRKK